MSATSRSLNVGTLLGREDASNVAVLHAADPDCKIAQTIAYMRDNLTTSLQVADLAALAKVSASHYFSLFKRRTGSAPMDYFIRLKMQRACHLLDTTSLQVKEVAAALGYDDQFYFSRLFKSVNEVSPREYRTRRLDLNTPPQTAEWKAFEPRPVFPPNRTDTVKPTTNRMAFPANPSRP